MRENPIVKNALKAFKENELIHSSKLYRERLSGQITQAAYYKTLERMCKVGELTKIAKGTYCIPKIGKYGVVPPSENDIVSAFINNKSGTVIGYHLYNSLNLTTQISKTVTVLSSALESFSKSIRNVIVHQTQLDFTDEVKNIVHGLEVLQNFSTIQDINYSAFIEYAEKLALSFDNEVFDKVVWNKQYKKSTISFFREILNYYDVENNLDMYLSSLSEYKHPKMEELYESSRIYH